MILLSVIALLLGVAAYGFAGAQLHSGSREDGGALRSTAWWTGTVLQAVGFLATLFARTDLPLAVVQATAALGLVVTALVQHRQGVRRLDRQLVAAIGALVLGLAILGTLTVPGPAVAIRTSHMVLLGACFVLCALALALPTGRLSSGLFAGIGFAYGAIGARLVMGDAEHPLWIFWQLPWQTWVVGLLTGTGIVLGQVHMTRGLARHHAAEVLGPMYLVETLLPAVVGAWLMAEHPRHGSWLLALGALTAAALGTWLLTREGDTTATSAID